MISLLSIPEFNLSSGCAFRENLYVVFLTFHLHPWLTPFQYLPTEYILYVINSIFSYKADSLGLSAAISYNVQGPRLIIASAVKEIADVYERPRQLVDFKISKSLGKHFSVNFTIKDLFNAPVIKSYKHSDGWKTEYERYSYGTNYIASISYKL